MAVLIQGHQVHDFVVYFLVPLSLSWPVVIHRPCYLCCVFPPSPGRSQEARASEWGPNRHEQQGNQRQQVQATPFPSHFIAETTGRPRAWRYDDNLFSPTYSYIPNLTYVLMARHYPDQPASLAASLLLNYTESMGNWRGSSSFLASRTHEPRSFSPVKRSGWRVGVASNPAHPTHLFRMAMRSIHAPQFQPQISRTHGIP